MAANEVELERLIVRFVAETEQYQNDLKEATKTITDAAKAAEDSARKIEKTAGSLEKMANAAVGLAVAFSGKEKIKDWVHAYADAEQISLQLNATLKANGREVERTREEYDEFAKKIKETTTADDDMILKMLKTAEVMGLTGNRAQKSAEMATQLAGAIDGTAQSAESYMRFAVAMAEGDTERMQRLARMIPGLQGITDETELLAKANQMLLTGQAALAAENESIAGSLKNMAKAGQDWQKALGKAAADIVVPMAKALTDLFNTLSEMPAAFQYATVGLAAFSAAVIAYNVAAPYFIKGFVLIRGALAGVIPALIHFPAMVAAGLTTAKMSALTMFSSIGAGLKAIVTFLNSTTVTDAFRMLTSIVSSTASAIKGTLVSALTTVKTAIMSLWASMLANPIVLVVAGIAALAGAITILTVNWLKDKEAIESFNRTLEQTKKLSEESVAGWTKFTEKVMEQTRGMDDSTKEGFLEGKLATAKKMMDQTASSAKQLQAELDDLDHWWQREDVPKVQAAKAALEAMNEEAKAAKEHFNKLQEELDKTKTKPRLLGDIREAVKAMEEARATMGMDPDEAQRVKFQRAGAKPKDLLDFDREMAMNKVRKAEVDLDAFNQELEKSNAVMLMDANAARIYEAQLAGLDESQLLYTRDLIETNKAQIKNKELMEEGKRLNEEFLSPQEKYNKRIADLNAMLEKGFISNQAYNGAVKQAQDELEKATNQAHNFADAIRGIDSAATGSAEALGRLAAYREFTMSLNKTSPTNPFGPGNLAQPVAAAMAAGAVPVNNPAMGAMDRRTEVALLTEIRDILKASNTGGFKITVGLGG